MIFPTPLGVERRGCHGEGEEGVYSFQQAGWRAFLRQLAVRRFPNLAQQEGCASDQSRMVRSRETRYNGDMLKNKQAQSEPKSTTRPPGITSAIPASLTPPVCFAESSVPNPCSMKNFCS